jgi:predicted RecA/RadA family phage recombinase
MSGNNSLGDSTGVGPYAATTVEADSDISAGDVVALDQGASDQRYKLADPANSGTADIDQSFAVAKEDISSGNRGTVQTSGSVIANVASGVSQGARLTTSTTAGQLADGDGTPIRAFSAEGGTDSMGTDLSANEAEVLL